jgi:hypothetical protein
VVLVMERAVRSLRDVIADGTPGQSSVDAHRVLLELVEALAGLDADVLDGGRSDDTLIGQSVDVPVDRWCTCPCVPFLRRSGCCPRRRRPCVGP